MKHLFLLLFMMLYCATMNAQKDVTTFLGIPVDGTKSEVRQKLIAKGFTPKIIGGEERLEGEFNGADVNVFIATTNSKVCRIMVCDAKMRNEANIRIRFNKLVEQFENNKRYIAGGQYTISDSENIQYGMDLYKKTYDALFYQNVDINKVDTLTIQNQIREQLLEKYTPEQLEKPTEEMNKEATAMAKKIATDIILHKLVWFRICEYNGEFCIAMYYDNKYNMANGEDL